MTDAVVPIWHRVYLSAAVAITASLLAPWLPAGQVADQAEAPRLIVRLAFDPSVPREFQFFLEGLRAGESVEWFIDGAAIDDDGGRVVWSMVAGRHEVQASVWRAGVLIAVAAPFRFVVRQVGAR